MIKLSRRAAAFAAAFLMSVSVAPSMGEGLTAYAATSSKVAAAPKASVESGIYDSNRYVKLTSSTKGARIFYTLDGSEPSVDDMEYKDYIRCKGKVGESVSYTIRAIAISTGYEMSEISEFNYTIELPSELEVVFMELDKAPTKKTYKKGEDIDVTGGTLLVTYEDYSYKKVSITKNMVSDFNSNTAGEKTVTVNYAGYTDSFTVNVKDTSSGSVSKPNSDSILNEETPIEDYLPRIKGASEGGWGNVVKSLSAKPKGSTVTIDLNGVMAVPTEVIRAARTNELTLVFEGIKDNMYWTLDTSTLSEVGITGTGLGIRTNAIYIPDVYIKNIGGTLAKTLHFNSSNKLNAAINMEFGTNNDKKYASLFRFDQTTRKMELVYTVKLDNTGSADFVPADSGDYIVILDLFTKIKGDLNNDMEVDQADFDRLFERLSKSVKITDQRADMDNDGDVDLADALTLYKQIMKKS